MVNRHKSPDSSIIETSSPITPEQSSDKSRGQKSHDENDESVVLVLHSNEDVRVEIGDVGAAYTFGVLFEKHPTEMSVHQAFSDRVRVFLCVGISVVGTMIAGPPSDGSLNGTATNCSEKVLQRSRSSI